MEEIEIMYNNKKETILKYDSESNNRFKIRLNFIKILEADNIIFKEAYKLSKFWYNIKFNKCKYDKNIYIKIMNFDKLLEIRK